MTRRLVVLGFFFHLVMSPIVRAGVETEDPDGWLDHMANEAFQESDRLDKELEGYDSNDYDPGWKSEITYSNGDPKTLEHYPMDIICEAPRKERKEPIDHDKDRDSLKDNLRPGKISLSGIRARKATTGAFLERDALRAQDRVESISSLPHLGLNSLIAAASAFPTMLPQMSYQTIASGTVPATVPQSNVESYLAQVFAQNGKSGAASIRGLEEFSRNVSVGAAILGPGPVTDFRNSLSQMVSSLKSSFDNTGTGPTGAQIEEVTSDFQAAGFSLLGQYVSAAAASAGTAGFDTALEEGEVLDLLGQATVGLQNPNPDFLSVATSIELALGKMKSAVHLEESAVGPEDVALLGIQIAKGMTKAAVRGVLKLSMTPEERFVARQIAKGVIEDLPAVSRALARHEIFQQRRAIVEQGLMKMERFRSNSRLLRSTLIRVDLRKPVQVTKLEQGFVLEQWQLPGGSPGYFFSEPGESPARLGVRSIGGPSIQTAQPKVAIRYRLKESIEAFKTYAGPGEDFWSVWGSPEWLPGGAIQYIIDPKFVEAIPY